MNVKLKNVVIAWQWVSVVVAQVLSSSEPNY